MLLSAERPFVGAFAFCIPGATLRYFIGLVHAVLPASVWNIANGTLRFPRNLGAPVASSARSRPEIPGDQLQALAVHSSARERIQRVNARGIAKRRKRSAARWAAGSRSTFIVLTKPGNWSRRTRWREGKTERGCLILDPRPGNRACKKSCVSRGNGILPRPLISWRLTHGRGIDEEGSRAGGGIGE